MSEHQGLARRDHGQRPSCLLSPSVDRELSDRATGDTQTGPGLTSHWGRSEPCPSRVAVRLSVPMWPLTGFAGTVIVPRLPHRGGSLGCQGPRGNNNSYDS